MPPERTHPLQVLLVEDDDIDAMAIERAFRKASLDVDVLRTTSAEGALEALLDGKPRPVATPFVILLDLNMPGMGGHEFLDRVRSDERLSSSVIFVLTTSSAETDIQRAYRRQVAGYFVKDTHSGKDHKVVEALRAYITASWLPGDTA